WHAPASQLARALRPRTGIRQPLPVSSPSLINSRRDTPAARMSCRFFRAISASRAGRNLSGCIGLLSLAGCEERTLPSASRRNEPRGTPIKCPEAQGGREWYGGDVRLV